MGNGAAKPTALTETNGDADVEESDVAPAPTGRRIKLAIRAK